MRHESEADGGRRVVDVGDTRLWTIVMRIGRVGVAVRVEATLGVIVNYSCRSGGEGIQLRLGL